MSFELALLIVVALVAVALGLVCYHLLGRLEMLERSVQGGLQAPSTRLSREQFERRFRTAHARSKIASEIGTGLVIVVGPEHTQQGELARTLDHLPRRDLITVSPADELDTYALGITTTPYLFVVDGSQVRTAQPVASSADIVAALKHFG